jgi:hypothetical protein
VTTPAAGFDTQSGSGVGTLTSGGPGTIAWKFVDGGLGGASDSVEITIRDYGGTIALQGTAAAPGQFPGSDQPTGNNTAQNVGGGTTSALPGAAPARSGAAGHAVAPRSKARRTKNGRSCPAKTAPHSSPCAPGSAGSPGALRVASRQGSSHPYNRGRLTSPERLRRIAGQEMCPGRDAALFRCSEEAAHDL